MKRVIDLSFLTIPFLVFVLASPSTSYPSDKFKALVYDRPGLGNIAADSSSLFWTEISDTPLNKISLSDGTLTPLTSRMCQPIEYVINGQDIFWTDVCSGRSGAGCTGAGVVKILNRSSLDGTKTEALAHGDNCGDSTGGIIVDNQNAYWVSAGNYYTIEMTPKGGGPSAELHTSSYRIKSIIRDDAYVYWIEDQWPNPDPIQGYIKKMPLGGGEISVILESEFGIVGNIEINGTNIYYADRHLPLPYTYNIMKVSTNGGEATVVADLIEGFFRLAVDKANIYWLAGDGFHAKPLAGGNETISPISFDAPPSGFTIDATKAYWTETQCCAFGQKGSIKTMPLSGGSTSILTENVNAPYTVAVDAFNAYWIEGGPTGGIEGYGRIAKIPLGGGEVRIAIGGISADSGEQTPLTSDDSDIYIGDRFTIKKISSIGGPIEYLFTTYFYIRDIVTDGINIYWLEDGPTPLIRKMPVSGGTVTTLASLNGYPGPIRISNGFIYWLESYETIKKISVNGGDIYTVVSNPDLFIWDYVVDSSHVFFSTAYSIEKISIHGGNMTAVAFVSPFFAPHMLSLDDYSVAWINQSGIGKVTKNGGIYLYSLLWPQIAFGYHITCANGGFYWTDVGNGMIVKYDPYLIKPNGGEKLFSGSTYEIGWRTFRDAVNFKINYSLDSGKTWHSVHPESAFVTGTNYLWEVPKIHLNNRQSLIKIKGYDASNIFVGSDKSDFPFEIDVVRLMTPNGGETFASGQQTTISWTMAADLPPAERLILSYTLNNGLTWKKIDTTGDPYNDGSFEWTVPSVTKEKKKCKLKVTLKDTLGNNVGSDASDSFFTINPEAAP